MSALLVIFHPRRIPAAVESFNALDTDIAYISGGTEAQACEMFADVMADSDHEHLIVCADDCVIPQASLDAVVKALEDGVEVATGWCTLDATNAYANVCDRPIRGDTPDPAAYSFMLAADVRAQEPRFETGFAGLALTGMSREMWEQFPMQCFGSAGYASDFHLSMRLRDAGVPITTIRDGYVQHLKERWNFSDGAPHMRLLIGEIPREVIWRLGVGRDEREG